MEYNNEELNGGTNYSGPIYVERRGSGCLGNGLKIGCGFIAGIFVTLMGLAYFSVSDPLYQSINIDDSEDLKKEVRYFEVRSKKAKATIHTGMPKDSVILLLGQPTEFMSTDYIDEITYRYGNYDINSLRIEFEDGKVNSVTQH